MQSSQNELVTLLDKVTEAQTYWNHAATTSRIKIWQHPLENIFNTSYTKEVDDRINELNEQKNKLLNLLGELEQNAQDPIVMAKSRSTAQYCTDLLNTMDIVPYHIEKNWFAYTSALVGLGCAATVLATTQAGPATATLINQNIMQPANALYNFVTGNSDPSTLPTNVANNHDLLDQTFTNFLQRAATTPETADFMQEQLQNFPIDSLSFEEKEALFNQVSTHLLEVMPGELQTGIDAVHNTLESTYPAAQYPTAEVTQDNAQPFGRHLGNLVGMVSGISSAVCYKAPKGLELAQKLGVNARNLTQTRAPLIALLVQLGTTHAQQRNFQLGEITNQVHTIATQAKGILSLAPLALASYALYKGATSLYTYLTDNTPQITSLKKDLISLELELNKQRTASSITTRQRGLCVYLTTRLHNAALAIPKEHQASYALYIHELNNQTLNVDQKITIIECMFKEFSFLRA